MRLSIGQELAELKAKALHRSLRTLPAVGGRIEIEGKPYLNFASNDYLNLSSHPTVKAYAMEAVERYGCGATGSRLMTGDLTLHSELEEALAKFMGRESALVFGSGFLTNMGVLTALAKRGDIVFSDRLNHASLIDGMRMSGAKWVRYRHKDMEQLEYFLQKHTCQGRRIIVTDTVFSMDGDVAPMADIAELAKQYDTMLVVDEAHAVGIFDRGVCAALQPDVVIGTLGKALGGYGGFVTGNTILREYLINMARPFIYSTGLPPGCLGSALGALHVLETMPNAGPLLLERAGYLHGLLAEQGLTLPPFGTHIIPVVIGDNDDALKVANRLYEDGIIATAVRPPTVPAGTARLRLSVTLAHEKPDLERLAECLGEAIREITTS